MAPPDQRRHQCRQRHTISSLSSAILSNRSSVTLVTHQSPWIQTHTTTWPMIHWSTYPNPSLNPQLQTHHLTHDPHSSPIQTQPTTITDLCWSTSIQNPKSTPISMPWPRTKLSSSASLEWEKEMWDERKSEDCEGRALWERESQWETLRVRERKVKKNIIMYFCFTIELQCDSIFRLAL